MLISRFATAMPIRDAHFYGYALFPHLQVVTTASGEKTSRRSDFGQLLYDFLFGGNASLLSRAAEPFVAAVESVHAATALDALLMVPPRIERRDYRNVVLLTSEISRRTGIPLLQHCVRRVRSDGEEGADPSFCFASPAAARSFEGKRLLVLSDFYRTGRSLHAFCRLLREAGGAKEVTVVVGTMVGWGSE
jgi:predicted amidophosphoribosyltransferase